MIQGRGWLGLHVASLLPFHSESAPSCQPGDRHGRTRCRYFDSIVFEGGGGKGAVYAGALVALDEHKVLSNVKKSLAPRQNPPWLPFSLRDTLVRALICTLG